MSATPYFEGFYAVVFTKDFMMISPINQARYKALEGNCAEVNIPYKDVDRGYTMICMLVELPNDVPAIWESLQLMAIVADFVKDHRDEFTEVKL